MKILLAAICGFILDLIIGDPEKLTSLHPVVIIGRGISFLEKHLRAHLPKTMTGERVGGIITAVIVPASVLLFCGAIIYILEKTCPTLSFAVQVIWCCQALAVKNLKDESTNVYNKLKTATIDDARKAVGRIVGRDTAALDESGIVRAAVETVAENFSDGVIAPMFYMFIGGAPLALCYKSINTMDSMLGYKNERYLYFGTAPAKLDDAANYIPARLAALVLIFASFICREDGISAWHIWRRDRRNHASPNSAQCEAVMAGALHIQLGGPAYYFGTYHDKPTIGDKLRERECDDIRRACRLLYVGSTAAIIIFSIIRLIGVII